MGMPSGHMPGAANVPVNLVANADGTVKDGAALRDLFAAAGVTNRRPVVTTCGSGVTACVLAFGMVRAGFAEPAVYDGSWTEWAGPARNHQGSERLTMADKTNKEGHGFTTRMSHAGRAGTHVHGFVNPGVHRGSTVLFPNCQGRIDGAKHRFEQYMTYGTRAARPTTPSRT